MNPQATWRLVAGAQLRAGRGGLPGPDTARRARWWVLKLVCGHKTERTVRYKPSGSARYGGPQRRSSEDILPAPKRVKCAECAAATSKSAVNHAGGE